MKEKEIQVKIQEELTNQRLELLFNSANFRIPLTDFKKTLRNKNLWYQDWSNDDKQGHLQKGYHCKPFKGHLQIVFNFTYKPDSPGDLVLESTSWDVEPLITIKIEADLKDIMENILYDFHLGHSYRLEPIERKTLESCSEKEYRDYVLDSLKFIYELILHERLKSQKKTGNDSSFKSSIRLT